MKTLIIYDSLYGNTEKTAQAIGGALTGEVTVLRAGEVNLSNLGRGDLLVVGSPTQGGRPTKVMQEFLNNIPANALKSVNVATFDTRVQTKIAVVFGYAAGKIANSLKKKGATLVATPEGFFVQSTKGPLKEGELERAASWAKSITVSQ
jgi:flavodoxin I